MLNKVVLKAQILSGLTGITASAAAEAFRATFPEQTAVGKEIALQFGQTFAQLFNEPVADVLANAIDFYVKNASVQGTIITMGSPVTQTAMIMPAPTPLVAGVIPNTFKIL